MSGGVAGLGFDGRPTEEEVERMRGRRPGIRASMACEGMVLTDEEEGLLDRMEDERMTPRERRALVLDFARERLAARRAARDGQG